MTNYINSLRKESSYTFTENGAKTHSSSLNALVDMFGTGGAYRKRTDEEIIDLFSKAFSENKNDAMKILYYLRDARGGQGERRFARVIYKYIADNKYISENKLYDFFEFIVEYGRWDDLFSIMGTSYENNVIEYIGGQIVEDMSSDTPSLMAKWLPTYKTDSFRKRLRSYNDDIVKAYDKAKPNLTLYEYALENYSDIRENIVAIKNKKSRLGNIIIDKICEFMKITNEDYRKTVSAIRKKLDIIERKISKGEYTFDYSKVPSKAMLRYKNLFVKYDNERYQKYLDSLEKGETKINTSTLYPYEIISKVYNGFNNYFKTYPYDKQIDLTWQNLPDYVEDNGNSIVVADTSGSMSGQPMEVSLSLAVYMAERNKGVFKDHMITFSSKPSFVKLEGNNIYEKVRCIPSIVENTNIQAVFDLLLNTAIGNKIPQEEMINTIYIVSDMEFDVADRSNRNTNFEVIKDKYAEYGYEMPNLVFWNVDSRNNNMPVTYDDRGVMLVSGCSPTIFKQAIERVTPIEFMYKVINGERYSPIKLFE